MNEQLSHFGKSILRYRVLIFLLVVLALYCFVALRVHSMIKAEPPQSAVDSKTALLKSPHIDKSIITKVKQLHDNSVNVRSLFNQTRNNPFHE